MGLPSLFIRHIGCGIIFAALLLATMTGSPASAQTFTLTLQPNTLQPGTANASYSQMITAVGGYTPYSFALTSGTLPGGITLDPGGLLSGTPTTASSYSFTITATDSQGNTGYRLYTFSIGTAGALTISPGSLPNGTQGNAYGQMVSASGGSGGYTYSVSGSLPPGLSLNANTGSINGTPSAGGSYSFSISAIDSSGNTGSQNYSVNIGTNSLTVGPSSFPNGTQGSAYNQSVIAAGGTGPYTYSVSSGSLPSGLSFDGSSGAISGTPTGSGPSNFTIQARDSNGNVGRRSYTVTIGTNSLTVAPAAVANGTKGSPYSQTVTASGGTGSYSFSVTSGALPNGLSLSSSGGITGTPSTTGTFNFTVQATDTNANTGSKSYSVTINPAPPTIAPSTLPAGTQGVAYNQTISASGGTTPYSYSVISGALPPGMSLNSSSGAMTGTPTSGGSFPFTIQATDSSPTTASQAYTLTIGTNSLSLSPSSLSNGTQGLAYSQTVTASGGSGTYSYSVTLGALPAGLSLNSGSGAITGTPSGSGNSSFTVQASDSNGNIASRPYSISVGTNSLILDPSTLPNGTQGVAYSQTIIATGGTGPYTYSVTSGALPTGLSLNGSSGAITGSPTGSGSASFTIQANDAKGNIGSRAYALSVGSNSLTVNPSSLPTATRGVTYNQTVSATGGYGSYSFAVIAGALPAGLSLNSASGAITGTPSTGGSASFSIQAKDTNGNIGSRAYSISVGTISLTVNPSSLPNGTMAIPYAQSISTHGGSGSYTYSLTAGALPAGLSLNTTSGAISGTPSASGMSSFTVQASDSNGNIGSRAFAVNIGVNTITLNPPVLPAAIVGRPYSQRVTGTGGTPAYTYSLTAGALPPGITLDANSGALTGTTTAAGVFTFTIQVSDSIGNIGSRNYALSNRPDPAADAGVQDLLSSQVSTARRFASTQTENVARHLERLHSGANPCSVDMGIGLSQTTPSALGPNAPASAMSPTERAMPAGETRPAPPNSQCSADNSFSVWSSGTVQFGTDSLRGTITDNRYTTSGVTAGLDWNVATNLTVGVSAGYGLDHSQLGLRGTISDADSISASLYSSWRPFSDNWFIDGLVGFASLGFNGGRLIADDQSTVFGKRGGFFWMGSIGTGFDLRYGDLKLTPYLRADLLSVSLGSYAETGPSSELLSYQSMKFYSVAGVAGLRAAYAIPVDSGVLTPIGRIEYRQATNGSYAQSMYYTDLGPSTASTFNQAGSTQGTVKTGVALQYQEGISGLTAELGYEFLVAASKAQSQLVRGSLKAPF